MFDGLPSFSVFEIVIKWDGYPQPSIRHAIYKLCMGLSGNRVSLNPVGHDHSPYQNAMFGVYTVFRHPHIIYVGENFPDVPL